MTKCQALAAVAGLSVVIAACSGGESGPAAPAEPAPSEVLEKEGKAAAPSEGDMVGAEKAAYADLIGNAANGKSTFVACIACHSIQPGENKTGPSLAGVVGRPAGSVAGFSYSPATKSSGVIWSEEQLYRFLEAPRKVIPGTKMIYPGLPDAQKRVDLISYLKNPT